ncbi:inactive 2'-5'-oligoadenylate synthase 1B-like [Anneissia japonica]|uniref:inactive 2'-5'-oligoadenylate synthase 1B-like n=1 Tax=Anneissia japonica TaxID=1529436 RepID=UPI0014255CDA|nr:inactive 2'-5'-oligoadenylate synthase 1B-like [Anneissia japonica]
MLRNYELRDYFSSALTEVRLEVFSKLPFKLKNLMRLLNHWNIHIAQRHSNQRFSANFVESLVIWCWKRAGAGDDVDTAQGMKTVMCELAKGTAINIDWQGCHLIDEYQPDGQKTIKHPELPLVLDPVNPTINMCEPFNNHKGTGISFWQSVSRVAMDTNKHPLLHDVTVW